MTLYRIADVDVAVEEIAAILKERHLHANMIELDVIVKGGYRIICSFSPNTELGEEYNGQSYSSDPKFLRRVTQEINHFREVWRETNKSV